MQPGLVLYINACLCLLLFAISNSDPKSAMAFKLDSLLLLLHSILCLEARYIFLVLHHSNTYTQVKGKLLPHSGIKPSPMWPRPTPWLLSRGPLDTLLPRRAAVTILQPRFHLHTFALVTTSHTCNTWLKPHLGK